MTTPPAFRIDAKDLLALSARSNAPAARHTVGHLGAIVVSGTVLWILRGTAWAIPAMLVHAYLVAFLFTIVHETAHQTAFRTRACNTGLGHVAGLAIVLPYAYYRVFHWDHHRYTQDPRRDPELARPLPTTRLDIAWLLTGIPGLYARTRLLVVHAVTGRARKRWIPVDQRPRIVREARAYLLVYAAVLVASVATGSFAALWLWVVPTIVGQLFLRPYLLAEHTGCAHNADMLANTRTTYTNRLVRFFAWNMPYHAEHHAYPAVPFHALPRLNALLARHIVHTERGYPASTVAVLRHLSSPPECLDRTPS